MAIRFVFCKAKCQERNETLSWEMARGFVLYHRTKKDTEGANGQRLGFCKAKCHRTKRDIDVGNGQRLCLVLQNETRR